MGLEAHERAALLELMPVLEAGDPAISTAISRLAPRLVDELAARPGSDAVRALVLRAMGAVDVDTTGWVEAASGALETYAADVGSGDPMLLMERHPAWAGLASLELALREGSSVDVAVDAAERAARLGFASIGDGRGTRRGTVLWALSERADEAGWASRSRVLLDAAAAGPFDDPSDAARVLLLQGLGDAERESAEASGRLEAAASHPDADGRTRTHARWVLHAMARDSGDRDAAIHWLDAALADSEDEPDPVVERLRHAHAALNNPD
jgi:hypothetical protein